MTERNQRDFTTTGQLNISKKLDLATASLANSRTRVLIEVSHPSPGTCSHFPIDQYHIWRKEKRLNGV